MHEVCGQSWTRKAAKSVPNHLHECRRPAGHTGACGCRCGDAYRPVGAAR